MLALYRTTRSLSTCTTLITTRTLFTLSSRPQTITNDTSLFRSPSLTPTVHISRSFPSPTPSTPSLPYLQYLSFFLYTHIPQDELFIIRLQLHQLLTDLEVQGRIFISTEGINAQMTVPVRHVEKFKEQLKGFRGKNSEREMRMTEEPRSCKSIVDIVLLLLRICSGGLLYPTDITLGDTFHVTTPPIEPFTHPSHLTAQRTPVFVKLQVKIRNRIVQDGLDEEQHVSVESE